MSAPRSLRLSPSGPRQPYASDLVDVTWFGASPDGRGDPSGAFARAAAFAAQNGGRLYVPEGTYGDGNDWSFALPSTLTMCGDGDVSNLVNCHLTATGTVGAEAQITAATARGATVVPVATAGLAANDWVRVASIINANSPNAGIWQLGHDVSLQSYLAEFAQVKSIDSGAQLTLLQGLTFPYSNVPGGDSNPAFAIQASVLFKVNFHVGGKLQRLKFTGRGAAFGETLLLTYCRDFLIEDVTLDANDLQNVNLKMDYCLDCKMVGGANIGKKTSVALTSANNQALVRGCQRCVFEGVRFEYGHQCLDVESKNGSSQRGGPCIQCGAVGCSAVGAVQDGFTSHPGNYQSRFERNEISGCLVGVRIRSRGDLVRGNQVTGVPSTAGSAGLYIYQGAALESIVSDNVVDGADRCVNWQLRTDSNGADYNTLLGLIGPHCVISKNQLFNAGLHGIFLDTVYTTATKVGPRIVDNEIHSPANDGIRVSSYANGTIVRGNKIYGIAAAKAAIGYVTNIQRLFIDENHAYGVNAAGFAVQGPAVGSFITDLVTFPAGDAEAQLYVGEVYTDAATPFTGVRRSTAAFVAPQTPGYQPFVRSVGDVAPTITRQQLALYQPTSTGQSLRADARDTNNLLTSHQLVIRFAGVPNGNVLGSVGDMCSNTLTGDVYRKTSGANTNTGWVTP